MGSRPSSSLRLASLESAWIVLVSPQCPGQSPEAADGAPPTLNSDSTTATVPCQRHQPETGHSFKLVRWPYPSLLDMPHVVRTWPVRRPSQRFSENGFCEGCTCILLQCGQIWKMWQEQSRSRRERRDVLMTSNRAATASQAIARYEYADIEVWLSGARATFN